MNRAPGKSDSWWVKHQAECGGAFTKIQEPAPTKKQLQAMTTKERAGRQKNKIDSWITTASAKRPQVQGSTRDTPIDLRDEKSLAEPSNANNLASSVTQARSTPPHPGQKRVRPDQEQAAAMPKKLLVECPICSLAMAEPDINHHLDIAHC